MRRFAAAFVAVLPLLAQQSAQLSLDGTVANSKTGEPIRRALVTVTQFGPPGGEPPMRVPGVTRSAFTDAGGVFHFTALPAGQYGIRAEKPEYTADRTAPQPFLTLDAPKADVRLLLSPLGVITGTITDQDGLPLRGVDVVAISSTVRDGFRQLRTDRDVVTDDRGIYRFWNVTPGRYYVKVEGLGKGTVQYAGDVAPSLGDEAFAPIYAGGSRTLEDAMATLLDAGAEVRQDFRVSIEPAFRIRGSLANVAPRGSPVKFELLTSAEDISTTRVTLNRSTGRFDMIAVPGSYLLRATQDDAVAEIPVTVKSSDVRDISMALSPPVNIPVVTRFTNSSKPARTVNLDADDADEDVDEPGGCSVQLRTPGRPTPISSQQVGDTPEVTIPRVPPGRYGVAIHCFGAFARSAISGSQDLAANPVLTVLPGVAPAPVEITATQGGGTIRGKIKSGGPGQNPVTVLLVPQVLNPQSIESRRVGRREESEFEFAFGNVAPGSYMLHVLEGVDLEFRNPELLRALPPGALVQVDEGREVKITLPGAAH